MKLEDLLYQRDMEGLLEAAEWVEKAGAPVGLDPDIIVKLETAACHVVQFATILEDLREEYKLGYS